MQRNNRTFFHPVLSEVGNDFLDSSSFTFDCDLNINAQNEPSLSYQWNLHDDEISDLIDLGEAQAFVDIRCSATLLRKLVIAPESKGTVILDEGSVWQSVSVSAYILATANIRKYNPQSINQDYEGHSFDVNIGAPLAISNSIKIELDFDHRNFRNFLFIAVSEQEPKGTYRFDFSQDKIIATVSPDISQVIEITKANENLRPFGYMSFYKDCLVAALEIITTEQSEISQRWSSALKDRVDELQNEEMDRLKSFEDYNRVALKLLRDLGVKEVLQKND